MFSLYSRAGTIEVILYYCNKKRHYSFKWQIAIVTISIIFCINLSELRALCIYMSHHVNRDKYMEWMFCVYGQSIYHECPECTSWYIGQ